MLGHRIFIIRQGDQARFDAVESLEGLRQIPLGQGSGWGDTEILKAAGMKVITAANYASLFYMLEGGRFNFFPRALHEPWDEVEQYADLDLTVEKRILLVNPFALHFYVGKQHASLAKDVERNLRNPISDGSYDELFFSNPMIKNVLDLPDLENRVIFPIPNPNLPTGTPVDDKSLLLNIDKLKKAAN